MDAMHLELSALSSEALAQIHDALHDLKDAVIHEVTLDLLWERHATTGVDWPMREATIGNPNDIDRITGLPTHMLRGSCAHGTGVEDKGHQVARRLCWSYEASRGPRTFSGWQCTCGRRSDRRSRNDSLRIVWRQARANAGVWPCVTISVAGRDIPHFQVCKYAAHAEDPGHAPNEIGMQCLCGGYLGRHNSDGSDKFLPLY